MKIYTTKDLADEFGCARITVIKWCEKNEVPSTGIGKRKTYLISEKHKKQFKPRSSAGRPPKD